MKDLLHILIICILFAACSDDYDVENGYSPSLTAKYLAVSPTSFRFNAEASSEHIKVDCNEAHWKFDNDASWITISPKEGSTSTNAMVSVTTNHNVDEPRVGVFYFQSTQNDWEYETPISVVQEGQEPSIKLSNDELFFSGKRSSDFVTINANCAWKVQASEDWIHIQESGNKISITVDANTEKYNRNGNVIVSYSGLVTKSESITIHQAPATITASTNTLEFENTASVVGINIEAEADWVAGTNSSWLEIDPAKGSAGTSQLKISVAPNLAINERTDFIIFSIGGSQRIQIPVRQKGIYIDIDKTNITFDASGGEKNFSVSSNTSWEITGALSWLTVNPSKGENNSVVRIIANDNPNTSQRTAAIRIAQPGLSLEKTIIVTQEGKFFNVLQKSLEFEDVDNPKYIRVETNGQWKATTQDSWLTVSPASGNGTADVLVSVHENETTADRNGVITFTMGDKTSSVSVHQRGKYMNVSSTALNYGCEGGSQTISIDTNSKWNSHCDQNWITITPSSGSGKATLYIAVSENESDEKRSGKVYVEMTSQSHTIDITQNGKIFNLSSSVSNIRYNSDGGKESFNIFCNTSWDITEYPEWISLTPSSGKGNSEVLVTASKNLNMYERSGLIRISDKSRKVTISIAIYQAGKDFDLTTNEKNIFFNSKGGQNCISLNCNTSWYIISKPQWISASPIEGENNSVVTLTAQDNPLSSERSGVITFSTKTGDIKASVTLQQAGKSFDVGSTVLHFGDTPSEQSITIYTDGNWSAIKDASWISISPSAGNGDGVIKVSVSENSTDKSRTGYVTITVGDKSIIVTINQTGKYFTISDPVLKFSSKGGNIQLDLSSNGNWTATVDPQDQTWLSLSKQSGNGNASITISAKDNASVNSRKASILFDTPFHSTVKIEVTQDARFLTIDTEELLFYSKGGTSQPINVTTDGVYSVLTNDSWLTIKQSANTFTVTATENKSPDPRYGSVTIQLTDLKEGTLSLILNVIQLNYGGTFLRQGYQDDKNWDTSSGNGVTIGNLIITPYNNDNNWDSGNHGNSSTNGTNVEQTGYANDIDWDAGNAEGGKGGNISQDTYGNDKNWDSNNQGSQTSSDTKISVVSYNSDKNWDPASNFHSTLSVVKTGYNSDKNYDPTSTETSKGVITQGNYNNDKNWN